MAKQGNKMWFTFGIIAVIALLGVIAFGVFSDKEQTVQPGGGGPADDGGITVGACNEACPDNKAWAGTINVENPLNSTGTETYDTTMYFFHSDGSLKRSITDTTAGDLSSTPLECGRTYNVAVLSTSGAAGDSSRIISGPQGSTVKDGVVTVTACGTGSTWTFKANQHGLPEVKSRDLVNDGNSYDGNDATNNDYESTDGTVFYSATDNSTCISVDAGGELAVRQTIRANVEDQDVNDLGMYILVDAPVTTWDIPTVEIDGSTASEASASLNDDERIAYSDYEYVYFVPAGREITKTKSLDVELSIFALGGQDPTGASNVSIDYAPKGRFSSSKTSNVLLVGSVDDSSSRSDIHTRFDTVQCVA